MYNTVGNNLQDFLVAGLSSSSLGYRLDAPCTSLNAVSVASIIFLILPAASVTLNCVILLVISQGGIARSSPRTFRRPYSPGTNDVDNSSGDIPDAASEPFDEPNRNAEKTPVSYCYNSQRHYGRYICGLLSEINPK